MGGGGYARFLMCVWGGQCQFSCVRVGGEYSCVEGAIVMADVPTGGGGQERAAGQDPGPEPGPDPK